MRLGPGIAAIASCLATTVATVGAQPGGAEPPEHSRVRLISESDALTPGSTGMLALVFEFDKGWHGYADSQNESGSALIATWSLPEGVEIGQPIWTASRRHVSPGDILDHIYEDSGVVLFPVTVTTEARVGDDAVLSASLEWLVCDSNLCVPQFAEVSVELPVSTTAARGPEADTFDKARQNLGTLVTGARDDAVILSWRGDTLLVECLTGHATEFIPGPGCPPAENLLEAGYAENGRLELAFDFEGDQGQEVVGWVRLLKPADRTPTPAQSTMYLVRLERGKKPARILGQ